MSIQNPHNSPEEQIFDQNYQIVPNFSPGDKQDNLNSNYQNLRRSHYFDSIPYSNINDNQSNDSQYCRATIHKTTNRSMRYNDENFNRDNLTVASTSDDKMQKMYNLELNKSLN